MARLRFAAALSSAVLCAVTAVAGRGWADEPKASLRGEMPADLREVIVGAVGESPRPPASRLDARRRARDAAEDVISALRSEGYYAYEVEPDVTEDEPGRPVVGVTPGPQFLLRNPRIAWQGGDPPPEIQGVGVSAMQLLPGEPGRAGDIIAAEGRIGAAVQKLGYADAVTNPRDVVVDHADRTVSPEFRITPGALVLMDGIDLRTEGRTNPAWIRSLSPWTEGDVYDPEAVAELERRLLDVGVYESVTVSLAPKDQAVGGLRPIVVSLADRPRSTLEIGAGYSTTEGVGVDARYARYNRLGRADTFSALFRFAEIERRLEGQLSLPHWRKAQRTLVIGAGVYQEITDAYDEAGVNAHIDLTRRYSKTTYRTYGVAIDLTRTDERVPVVRERDLATLTGLVVFALDRSDDPLNPRRGWRVEGRTEPTLSIGDGSAAYLRVLGQGSIYYPFGEQARTIAAGRLRLGSVLGGSLDNIPAARRLYAGGGGSVRGYAYQGVGPRLSDNVTPQGGLGVFEASVEIRHRFTQKWGGVAFIDVGGVSPRETPDFSNVSTGVGFGVRYDLGFGPIRADIAVPLTKREGDPSYQIYLSIGQSFLTEDATQVPQQQPARRRLVRRPRTALGWFMAAMVALVLLVAAVGLVGRYSVLSPQGLLFLEARTEGLKLGRVGKLKIEGLSGDIWRNFKVRRLTISDEAGVWVEARNVGVVWNAGTLLRRRMHASSVVAEQVTVLRRPTLTPKTKSRGLPLSFDIDSVKARVETKAPFSVRPGMFDLAANFRVERRGGGEGRVQLASLMHLGDGLKADFMYGKNRPFRINVDAVEASGGALAGALGLPASRPFNLVSRVNGDAKAGKAFVRAMTGAATPLEVDGSWNGKTGQGTARLDLTASTLTAKQVGRFGPEAEIRVSAKPSTSRGAHDAVINFRSDNLVLVATGPVNFVTRTIPQGLAINARVAEVSRLSRVPKMGAGRFVGTLAGKPADFLLKGNASVDELSLAGYRLGNAAGPVSVRLAKKELTIVADAVGKGGRGSGVLAGLFGAAPRAKATISRLADGRLLIRSLDARGSGITAKATGSRSILGGLSFSGDARISNLPAIRRGASGVVTARWSASRGGNDRPWAFTADARGTKFATGMVELDRLIGPSPRVQAAAAYKNKAWAFSKAHIDGAAGQANGAGIYGPNGLLKFTVDWSAKGPFNAGPVEIAGRMEGKGAVTGTVSSPRLDLTAQVDGVEVSKLTIGPAAVSLVFAKGPNGSNGIFRISGASNYGPARAAAQFRFAPGGLDLSDIDANAGGVMARGSLALRNGQPSRADLTLALTPGAFLAAGRADGRVSIVDAPGGPLANMHITGTNMRWGPAGGTIIRSADLTASGPLSRLPYTLKAEARVGLRPISLDGSGIAADAPQGGWTVSYEGGGKVDRAVMRTITPLIVAFGGPELSAVGALSIGGGRVDIDARQREGAINVRTILADVDLSVLSPDMAGKFDATLTASGRGNDLIANLDAALQDARSRDGPKDAAIDGTFKAALRGDRLALDLVATNDKGLRSTASFVLPAEASATPFRIAINRRRQMEGRFDVNGELQPIWDLFFGGSRTLGGTLTAQGTVAGTLGDPRLSGQATLANGRFEDFATGLRLRNVSIAAALNTDAVTVSRFTGEDGRGGALTGEGRISLERAGGSTFKVNATRFMLIDNDLGEAQASGTVTVTRDAAGKAALVGKLTIDRADIVANPPTPSGVVAMEVVEVNMPTERAERFVAPSARGPSVALDVSLTAPRRIFLRGRGLDAELSLDAHVGGTTAAPALSGTARIVRGDYDFAGKRFEFDERGVVYLASTPARIRLDLSATRDDPSLNAVVKITGTAAKPQITLTSTPTLPSDEVLSQVLFGRSASQLSPLEAAQLAAALTSLATGGGFDVIGGLRAFAGLDRLAIAGGDETGVSVSGGKYITDDVYLELTGGGREGTSAQVEWRVRRNLFIVSRLTGEGDTRLSVRWRRNSRKAQ